MRKFVKKGDFSVTAISGTYVVYLGFNATQSATKGLLGFAIHRTNSKTGKGGWIRGMKTFKETVPNPEPDETYSTLEHPVQSFHWGDYTVKPDQEYEFKVVPLFGKPNAIKQGKSVEITIQTQSEDKGTHAIFFNRGVAGSQAYNRKFKDKKPEETSNREGLIWLSRGLEEALIKFIGQANGPRYSLRAAVYEFNYDRVLQAFKKASTTGADIKIVYDARKVKLKKSSEEAINDADIADLMIKRTQGKSYISHNKFIILLEDGKPLEVWTGSTNITKSGIFGQCNVGHIVRDTQMASEYLDYWKQLAADTPVPELRKWIIEKKPDLTNHNLPAGIYSIFSPRKTAFMLQWYADAMDSAKETACLTQAFGVDQLFENVLSEDKDYCRYLILEKEDEECEVRCNDFDLGIAWGAHYKEPLYQWTAEKLSGFGKMVFYIHTKFLLIDPLSKNPTTITGSANFSDESIYKNDENSLIIQGDTRVADIYFGEFMRIFNHFYARCLAERQRAAEGSEDKERFYLKPDDTWLQKYYMEGSKKKKERMLLGRDLS